MFMCCKCGRKLTNRQTYYVEEEAMTKRGIEVGKRPVCKLYKKETK